MAKTIRLKFGKRVKELRKKNGITQEELAEKTGIDYKYIQRIEGKNPPAVQIDTIERIAKVLKVKPSHLIEY